MKHKRKEKKKKRKGKKKQKRKEIKKKYVPGSPVVRAGMIERQPSDGVFRPNFRTARFPADAGGGGE